MRGTVEIEDTAGGGTTIVISLPVAGGRRPSGSSVARRETSARP
jgi:hypothetical protein